MKDVHELVEKENDEIKTIDIGEVAEAERSEVAALIEKDAQEHRNALTVNKNITDLIADDMKKEIVVSGPMQGMDRLEALAIKQSTITSKNLPQVEKKGKIDKYAQMVRNELLSNPPELLRDKILSDFPYSTQAAIQKSYINAGIIFVAFLAVKFLSDVSWKVMILPIVLGAIFIASGLKQYNSFAKKDYIELRGIIDNVIYIEPFIKFRKKSGNKAYVQIVTTEGQILTFVFPKQLKKEDTYISKGVPITIFVDKHEELKKSQYGPMVEHIIGYELGETDAMAFSEVDEDITIKDFVQKHRE